MASAPLMTIASSSGDTQKIIPKDINHSPTTHHANLEAALEKQVDEEPFIFVSKKKKGRGPSNTKLQPTLSTRTGNATMTLESNVAAPSQQQLPGWGVRKPGVKIKKNSQRAKMMGSRGHEEERTIEWGRNMMDDRIMTLKQSKFYLAFRDLVEMSVMPPCQANDHQTHAKVRHTPEKSNRYSAATDGASMQEASTPLEPSQQTDYNETANERETDGNSVKDIICYGIGSIESSKNSQYQLALALCLKEILQISGTVSIYDPVMSKYDSDLARDLGFIALSAEDQTTKKSIEKHRTLLYMPHCPKGLYSQVLESNWSREQLNKMVIIGNRFTRYDESPSFRQHAKQAPFILPALSIATVSDFPKIKFEDDMAFNDLAIHLFPEYHEIPSVDLQDREEDPEMM
ncbi:hypothetical protein BGZ83_005755 [Gryganskiella cystojenkinii]|nr:hypothetical protein BGZ83_005755 [Gryganskiella cystojenkinii]